MFLTAQAKHRILSFTNVDHDINQLVCWKGNKKRTCKENHKLSKRVRSEA